MKLTNLTTQEREKYQEDSLDNKIKLAKKVIKKALNEFGPETSAVAWTGGKDSTLLLWLIRETARQESFALPRAVFIDEGDVFDEIWEFVNRLRAEWNLDFSVAHNKDVSSQAKKLGDLIQVANLNQRNQAEIRRLGYQQPDFPYEPESLVGNHLMKTVATNIWLEENRIKALFVGVRWDEQEARSEDDFWRPLENPSHTRIEPVLPFKEKEVWQTIHQHQIPYVKLYEKGYRSLGARVTTKRVADKPAWKQDLAKTTERAGRRQDKEKIMARLRDLGYM